MDAELEELIAKNKRLRTEAQVLRDYQRLQVELYTMQKDVVDTTVAESEFLIRNSKLP